jgi:hypothetical protein
MNGDGTLSLRDRSHRGGAARWNPDVEGLCLALADWSVELRILQNEQRRQVGSRRRERNGIGEIQAFTE